MSKELVEKKPQPSYAPVYAAALYPDLSKIAREHGYALAVHGSLQRDFDLIAVPWVENPSEPATVLDAITSEFAIRLITPKDQGNDKPHGRLAYSISIGHGDCALDISFMPVQAAAESRGIAKGRMANRELLEKAYDTLKHAYVFTKSREKMAGVGQDLYLEVMTEIQQAILSASQPQEIAGEGCETYQAACAAADGKGAKG